MLCVSASPSLSVCPTNTTLTMECHRVLPGGSTGSLAVHHQCCMWRGHSVHVQCLVGAVCVNVLGKYRGDLLFRVHAYYCQRALWVRRIKVCVNDEEGRREGVRKREREGGEGEGGGERGREEGEGEGGRRG